MTNSFTDAVGNAEADRQLIGGEVEGGVVSTIHLNFSGSTKLGHSLNSPQTPRVCRFSAPRARKVNWMLGRRHLSAGVILLDSFAN
ncbi:unnamed protein product [Urochloa humidicola]